MTINDDITYLKGVGEKRAKLFRKLEIETVGDLLTHYPRDYVDYTHPRPISELEPEETAVFSGVVIKKLAPYISPRYSIFKVIVSDNTDNMLITFFNSKYTFEKLEQGEEYIFHGKIKGTFLAKECNSPVFINAEEKNLMTPKYNVTAGLTANTISNCVKNALKNCETEDLLPENIREEFLLSDYRKSLQGIHFPENYDELLDSRRRLAFEELLTLQLGLKLLKGKNRSTTSVVMENKDISDFFSALPFTPTNAQLNAVKDCMADMQTEIPMNRLLQGDVGSGKTLVAAAICCFAAKNGYQSALMAPTEILAEQHYATICRMLKGLPVDVRLLTGSTKQKDRPAILEGLADGTVDILVGTHAVLEDNVLFRNIGLVVIDEQHRFGVVQRAKMWTKNNIPPHVLVMTATPIPRTLAMTLYGDLDVSVIDELPPGRKPISTQHIYRNRADEMYSFIRRQLQEGRQVYVVYPLISESEKLDLKNLEDGYKQLCNIFCDYRLSKLHGKMKPKEKDEEMRRFAQGETQMLVSTTVIEVGVDVPNASVMVIENAERFGLSQLHQLRGRVGRGASQSYCILVTDYKLSEDTRKRMEIMVGSNDGFEIAEADLKLRGPGDIEGTQQSGIAFDLKIANLARDEQLLQYVREVAREIVDADALCENPAYRILWERLREIKRRDNRHWGAIS